MKVAILIAFACVIAYASGEVCQCSSFFETHVDDAHKVHTAPNVELPSCDDTQKDVCKTQCETLFNKITDQGNLQHVTSKGTTVAQFSCDKYKQDITDGQLGCYYKLCDGQWTFIQNTKGKVCCHDSKEIPCAH